MTMHVKSKCHYANGLIGEPLCKTVKMITPQKPKVIDIRKSNKEHTSQ
jgi:phage FluMu protein Com